MSFQVGFCAVNQIVLVSLDTGHDESASRNHGDVSTSVAAHTRAQRDERAQVRPLEAIFYSEAISFHINERG
jgi:hypothetical protein